MSRGRRVAILGGGVAGLSTALDLLRPPAADGGRAPAADGGRAPADPVADVQVFEAAPRAGGNLRTEREAGFTVEWGPNGFLDSEPATLDLIERLQAGDDLQRSADAARRRFLLLDGRLQEIPLSPVAFLRTGLLSPAAKLRVGRELVVARRTDLGRAAEDPATDETVHAFGTRRLGPAFADVFLDPMVKGITGGDARRLSLAASFPRMLELEQRYGSLFRALFALGRERRRQRRRARDAGAAGATAEPGRDGSPSPGPAGVLHGFHGGIEVLAERLAAALGDRLLLGAPVEQLERAAAGWVVHAAGRAHGPFAAVVDATPAHAAARHQADPEVRRLLAQIPYAAMVVIALAFRRESVRHPLDGFGMLVPGRERRRLLGVLWSSSIFPGRAPDGQVLLRCMAGGPASIEMDDGALVELAMDELRNLYGLEEPPARSWIFRHPRAIAQYEVGHLARLRALDQALRAQPGLLFTGSSYRGVAINHCVREAALTARRVAEQIASD
ncbi:MAG: protoporphyrinogen oxidase [Candidatus Krumholzibacteriia bacterium]